MHKYAIEQEKIKKINSRSLFRLETEAPITITPFYFDRLSQKSYNTKMIDLSGSGCKIKLPDQDMPETDKMVLSFQLNDSKFKLYADVVRWNVGKRIIALKFTAPYESTDEEVDPLAWIEEKIIQFVFEQQRKANKTPRFYRHR